MVAGGGGGGKSALDQLNAAILYCKKNCYVYIYRVTKIYNWIQDKMKEEKQEELCPY